MFKMQFISKQYFFADSNEKKNISICEHFIFSQIPGNVVAFLKEVVASNLVSKFLLTKFFARCFGVIFPFKCEASFSKWVSSNNGGVIKHKSIVVSSNSNYVKKRHFKHGKSLP